MTPQEFDRTTEDFEAYYARFADLFPHPKVRDTAKHYLQGLLLDGKRKHGMQIAQAIGVSSDAIQRLLYKAQWDAGAVRDGIQRWMIETANVNNEEASRQAIVAIGETTFPKKGKASAGVHRHTNALTNKRENGQVGLFMSYDPRGPHRPVLCDRRLYLTEEWCRDEDRRRRSHIPEDTQFHAKSALALEMLGHAWKMGMPMEWVVGDTTCGDNPYLRDAVAAQGCQYVFAVSPEASVWRVEGTDSEPITVAAIVKAASTDQWALGLLGQDDWLELRVVEYRESELELVDRLLVHRTPTKHLTYYVSNAPASLSLRQLAQMALARMTVHDCLEVARREVGLADYETRYWHGWCRHMTLAMLAAAWKRTEYLQSARRLSLKRWLEQRGMDCAALVRKAKAAEVKLDINHLRALLKGKRPFSDGWVEKLGRAGVVLDL